MSEWKERSVKRRDFRSVKGDPDKPGALRGKKKRSVLVLIRYKPDYFEKHAATDWFISREARKSNNAWQKYAEYVMVTAAEQAVRHHEQDPYSGKYYEFKIIDTKEPK
jgi:hypothetical protein